MNDAWQSAARWLGISSSNVLAPQEFDMTLQATWPMPIAGSCLLIAAAAVAVAWIYWHECNAGNRRKLLLIGIRTLLVAMSVILLYGWTIQRHRTSRPELVVMLDDSASMEIADTGKESRRGSEAIFRAAHKTKDGLTRFDLAKSLLADGDAAMLRELERRYELKGYLAGETARAWPPELTPAIQSLAAASATQTSTRLGDLLQEVLETQVARPPAAVIFLTDGVVTEGRPLPAAAEAARRRGVPLFLIGLGSNRPPRDLHVSELLAPPTAFVGDWLTFEFHVGGEGFSGPAAVALKRKDSGETLAEETITLDGTGAGRAVRLSHRADAAVEFEFVVEVAPQPGEVNTANNTVAQKVIVQDAAIRVLLVQTYPSYEFRFLKQMLARELNAGPSDEKGRLPGVRTVLQAADPAYVATDRTAEPAFPASREELFAYDVVILSDADPALLSASMLENLYEFVTVRGGGLILVAGPRYMPLAYRGTALAPLFPIHLGSVSFPPAGAVLTDEFRPRLTALGSRTPALQLADRPNQNEALWRDDLTPLRWFVTAPDLRPAAQVLAEHPDARSGDGRALPIITQQFAGAGKVVFHATDETYRWRYRVGDVYFARYWVQTIRSLCRLEHAGSGDVELTTDRQRYRSGESAQMRLRLFDHRQAPAEMQGITVIVQSERGDRRSVTLDSHAIDRSLYEGSTGPLVQGEYSLRAVVPGMENEPAQTIVVTSAPGELAVTQLDERALRAAAQVSGGKYYTIATAGRLLAELPQGRALRIESLPPRPIWNSPLVAGVFIGLLTLEWALRKRAGML